ncbi:MAG: PBP1A family penicillin-binding protein [Lachnospiraceae bacterium]|nr:PBP1A family penicillin-binding protein [Lachnospiraceae bacterium]
MAKNKMKKVKKQKKHRKFWLGFKIFILLFLLSILVVGIIFYLRYGKEIFAMQDEAQALVQASSAETFRTSETSIAYNSKGKQIAVLKGEKDAYYLGIESIPDYAKDAFIATEDRKFYTHNGIDGEGIIRAAVELIKNNGEKTQGASTITQQLARGVFLTTEKTYERKIKEIFIAKALEEKYTKNQILEFYMNTIYFANGYYGLEAAARGYFSKGCQDLSLAQICFLCAIPNNPTLYDPEKRFDNTVKRKNRILDQMLSEGKINQVEYDEAYNEKIKLKIQEVKKRDYIQTFVSYCAIRALMKLNGFEFNNQFDSDEEREEYEERYDEEYAAAQQMLLNNGYRIYTSLDLSMQKKLQSSINHNLSGFKEKASNGTYKMQGAAVCIDNETGRVVAIVGGRSQNTSGYSLNRAYQSHRQPGSSVKPLIVYTPSLERGDTAYTTINDHKFKDGPSNSNGRYYGYVSLRFAVEHSLNTVAWQLFDKLTPEVGLDYLLQMNFNRIVSSDYYLPASLGGLTYGASPLEMASAYATLENNGKYREPTCIVKILDADGNTIVEDDVNEKYIYNADAANSMVDILTGVFIRGTAAGLGLDNGMPCAGKTGTTNDKKDGWFCGFTPYYTTAVWIGYDSPQTVPDLFGSTYPGRTWHEFMNDIHADLKVKNFTFKKKSSNSSSGSGNDSSSGGSGGSSGKGNKNLDRDSADNDTDVDTDEDDKIEPGKKTPTPTKVPAKTSSPTKPPSQTKAPATDPPDIDNDDDGYNDDVDDED